MRARYPDTEGYIERDGVRIFYEVFGEGEQTILLLPTWSLFHSRVWKFQVPYLARHFRVITFDGRGNGRSSRPEEPETYVDYEFAADALAVMDATATPKAAIVALSRGARWATVLAAEYPERVTAAVIIAPALPISNAPMGHKTYPFDQELPTDEGWAKYNAFYWRKDYPGFVDFFLREMFTEPHSTKQIEDGIGWGLETTGETLVATQTGRRNHTNADALPELLGRIHCPVLVIHGDDDHITPHAWGAKLAEMTHGALVTIGGGGHAAPMRDPVQVNLLINDFVRPTVPRACTWMRGRYRNKRALYISSPIGLGHAQRDVAIATELRKLHPDLQIDWLAQDPVTRVLAASGERIHPASALLANESSHIESESAEHDLHCFQALRRMDEILVANYMLFHDVVSETPYDLVIGDEAWEVDYFLHENPEEKRTAYAWLTDFVGYLPMPDGGTHESYLTTDYNAEMIEHIERFPRLRDRAIFVGSPDDIVPDTFGLELPEIRAWTERHYDFSGYITGFDPREFSDREALRQELGYRPDERVCIVTVGGSGVGQHLLRRVIAAFPEARRRIPNLHMIVVTGPRIAPESLPTAAGLDVRPYVYQLYRHLAACDLAIVQGGLTTCMELTANKRPFLYFPLRHHFEQNFHVRHRLNRYGAGRCMDYETATSESIASTIVEELGQTVRYRDVETDGAARAAARIAELI